MWLRQRTYNLIYFSQFSQDSKVIQNGFWNSLLCDLNVSTIFMNVEWQIQYVLLHFVRIYLCMDISGVFFIVTPRIIRRLFVVKRRHLWGISHQRITEIGWNILDKFIYISVLYQCFHIYISVFSYQVIFENVIAVLFMGNMHYLQTYLLCLLCWKLQFTSYIHGYCNFFKL